MKYIKMLPEQWTDTNRLQRVQNSAARLIKRARRRDHITLILQPLHWLSIKTIVTFKIYAYMYTLSPVLPELCNSSQRAY